MTCAPRSLARNAAGAAALGAIVPAAALTALTIATGGTRSSGHGGDWSALIYLYIGASAYLAAFLLHPVLLRARGYTGSFLIGVAFGAGGIAAVALGGLALGELRPPRDAGAAAEEALKVLAALVAHGLLALPLAGLVRLVHGAPEDDEPQVESGGPLSPLALVVHSLALATGAAGVLMLALFATGIHETGPGAWWFAAAPFVAVLAVAAWRLRQRLVPRWRALVLGACFGAWVAALSCAWFVTETRPRDLADLLVPLLVVLGTPALGAGLAAVAARG